MANSMLNTAVSGLTAYQRTLSVIGHNITNANTENYSRQDVELSTRQPNLSSAGFIGSGVQTTTVKRVYDQFLYDQVTNRSTSYQQLDTLATMSSRVDAVLANSDSGLSPAIQAFFNSVQDVANNPTSNAAREVMLSEGDTLANRFQALNSEFEGLRSSVNGQLDVVVADINGFAKNIADLNHAIVQAQADSSGQPPNDLLDKRDQTLQKLAELVSVRTVPADDGSLNVFIGNGQTLVLGADAANLTTGGNAFDPSQKEVFFTSRTVSYDITSQLNGGKLGGLLDFRDQVLNPAQDGLGRIAIALADTFNTQQQAGDDLNGNPGAQFFNSVITSSPTVFSNTNNNPASGTVSVTINDTNQLKASDYRLDYDGSNFTLRRLSDDTVVDSGFTLADFPRSVAAEGLTLNIAGSASNGDSFLIRPVRNAGRDMAVALTNSNGIAAAASGSAAGDNSNALAMAKLQTQQLLGGSTETYQDAYGKMISYVGVKASEAETNSAAQKSLLTAAMDAHSAVSGVNLDEEAAKLIRFQQAYQAAAQVVKVADTVFQTLLGVAGR